MANSNPRKDGNADAVDITTTDGVKLTLYVDSQTKLPSRVTTMTDNIGGPLGDMVVETSFANYGDTAGLKLPMRLTTKNDKYTVADIQVSRNTINGNTGDLSAPADVKSAQAPPAAARAMITVEEVGKGLWYVPWYRSICRAMFCHRIIAASFAPRCLSRSAVRRPAGS
jgi:hypothetical protein